MAALLQSDDEDQAQKTPTSVSTNTAGGVADSLSAGTAGTGSAGGTGAGGQTSNAQDVQAITQANQGVNFQPLLDTVRQQGTAAHTAANNANDAFNASLGTFSPFGSSDQSQLDSVLTGTTPLTAGQGLLGKTYTGPARFDTSSFQPLVDKYVSSASNTQSPNGISTLLGSLNPGLTPGERNYDALIYGANPGYQAQSQDLINDAAGLSSFGTSAATNANTAISQRQQDIAAFDQAARNYVSGQRDQINSALTQQVGDANSYDAAMQNAAMNHGVFANGPPAGFNYTRPDPTTLTVDPAAYAYTPEGGSSQPAPIAYNRTIDPNDYWNYTPGQVATRDNVATQDEATRYNNAAALLAMQDRLNPTTRQTGSMSVNQTALQAALAKAQADRDLVAQQDQAWLAAMQAAAANRAQPTSAVSAPEYWGDHEGSGGAAGDSGGGESSGAESGGAGDAEGGEGMAATGGLIRRGKVTGRGRAASPFSALPSGGRLMAMPTAGPSVGPAQSPVQAPLTQNLPAVAATLAKGGYIPPNAGPPGKDTVPLRVNNGEFVVRAPTVTELGPQNLIALNQLNTEPPSDQQKVRAALHAALSHARSS